MKHRILIFTSALAFALVGCTKEGAQDQAGDVLGQARQLAAEGKFEEALEKHIWFHEHALEVDRSYYGVRLSFALGEWVELGKQYPPALSALRKIRDEKTAQLVSGKADKELFHDVSSINDYLDESAATVELFKKIEVAQPEFAASVYNVADEALVEAEEYALARKYLGDPMLLFNRAKDNFDSGMEFAKTSQHGETSRQAFEGIFAERIARIITVLDKTGDTDRAREIQSKALTVLDHPMIRDAMGK